MGTDYRTRVYLGIEVDEEDFVDEFDVEVEVEAVASCSHREARDSSYCSVCGEKVEMKKTTTMSVECRWKPALLPYLDEFTQTSEPDFYEWFANETTPTLGRTTSLLHIYEVQHTNDGDVRYVMGVLLADISNNPVGDPVLITGEEWDNTRRRIAAIAQDMGVTGNIEQFMLLSSWA